MSEGFSLDKPTYTPKEFARLYTTYVHRISYVTALDWVHVYDGSGGREGIHAHRSPRGRYHIEAAEVRRVLLASGATEKG